MNKKKQLAKNTLIIFLGKVCTQLISFFLIPLYTAYLATDEYGIVDLVQTYVTLLVPIITMELEMSIFRYLVDSRTDSKDTKKLISNNFYILRFCLSLFIILYLLVICFIDIPFKWIILVDIIVCVLSRNFLQVARGMGMDSRIGAKFLVPGPGYGGFCFPKDTNAMGYMGKFNGVDLSLIEATIKGNEKRKINMAKRILDMVEDVKTPTVAVLGSAFKGGTDDCRESPALQIIEIMLAHDVNIKLYDPEAMENTKAILGDMVTYCSSAYEAIGGADVLAVLTDWAEFKELDLEKIKMLMRRPQIADYRNNFDFDTAKSLGFEIKSLGRKG